MRSYWINSTNNGIIFDNGIISTIISEIKIMLRWPCPHDSKHFPLYSPFHSNLNVVVKLILPGIASILIPRE